MPTASIIKSSSFFSDFRKGFAGLLSEARCCRIFERHGPRGGGLPKLSPWQWIMARVYHELARSGNFSANVKTITRVTISDSALSQRASSIGWKLVDEILPAVLRPLADESRHPEAFHGGYRLVALDGTRFNLRNTAGMKASAGKMTCSRGDGEPAFAHLRGMVLVELGLHQPLAATFGWQNEGELTLARRLISRPCLPERSLVLGDRLFGTPALLWALKPALEKSGGGYLLRVRSGLKVVRDKQLADGSWLVSAEVAEPGRFRHKLGKLQLREINAAIRYAEGSTPVEIRLWTSLIDDKEHPARTLVELYATRWEQELFFRELKSHLHGRDNLLDAQTPETAAQELLAMLLAAALIARQREAVARRADVEILRISFAKVLHKTAALCELLALGEDLIEPKILAPWIGRVLDDLQTHALIKKRNGRSCPRTLRQPVKDWPKTKIPISNYLVKTIDILTNP